MNTTSHIFDLIKASLWETEIPQVTWDDFEEMKKHAIVALPAGILSSLLLPPELYKEWEKVAFVQVAHFVECQYVQTNLPISVPYSILKGTSAAQYYPHMQFRMMGDIDIITPRDCFDTALKQLLENGYSIIKNNEREIGLIKNGIIIELHRHFATLNDPSKAKYLDDLVFQNINDTHILPHMINGLVILEHIDQHLENGIGLRQIIDWMMYVDKCLSDLEWPMFCTEARKLGLEKLAVVLTKMCEMYMGLNRRGWCYGADEALCTQLMEYILGCGNFGNKHIDESSITENVFVQTRTPKSMFILLQRQGINNWTLARDYSILRPFAWIYQLYRYIKRGLKRDQATKRILMEYEQAKRRNEMFDALEVTQVSKGVVIYKDGKYMKT